ncbi:MAG: hypothetical protein CSA62_08855 [Planctomycetota bacterium]|nr:MAG: hypothetical protein CSA62_08855 [Planctomycetota bacterium]
MRKRPFQAKCPCCGEKLSVDPELRRLTPFDKTKKPKDAAMLDSADDLLHADEKRRQDSFEAALEDEKRNKPSLDDLL